MIKHRWQQAVSLCQQEGAPFVLVTVIGTSGSTPREGGSKMVVTSEQCYDTIGGGKLELLAIDEARRLIVKGQVLQQVHHFPLAAEAQQCCGGSVTVMFESFGGADRELVVFGAGHVASALIKIVSELDMHVTWVDSRESLFPDSVPPGTEIVLMETPEDYVASMPSAADVVIVTHDHGLDYRLVAQILEAEDCSFLGLIGSATKAARFRKRLTHDGFSEAAIEQLRCPIGLSEVSGKLPMEVAVSIAAQLISLAPKESRLARRGLGWREIREVLNANPADRE